MHLVPKLMIIDVELINLRDRTQQFAGTILAQLQSLGKDFLSSYIRYAAIVSPVCDRVCAMCSCTVVKAFFRLTLTFELAIKLHFSSVTYCCFMSSLGSFNAYLPLRRCVIILRLHE